MEIKKLYYTISEVCKILSISQSKLRYWCDYFKIDVQRDTRGNRKFTNKNVEDLKWILEQQRVGLTMKGIALVIMRERIVNDRRIIYYKA